MRFNKIYKQSRFICQECRNAGIPICRNQSRPREKGHIKDLYCIHCKKETPHIELRNDMEWHEFWQEWRKADAECKTEVLHSGQRRA